jgi:hypothetical protein
LVFCTKKNLATLQPMPALSLEARFDFFRSRFLIRNRLGRQVLALQFK